MRYGVSFMLKKKTPENIRGKYGVGSIWTWVAMDAGLKICYLLSCR